MPAAWNPCGAVTPPGIGCQEEAIATADPPRDTGCILLRHHGAWRAVLATTHRTHGRDCQRQEQRAAGWQRGLPVLDADQFAREALTPGRPATTSVMQRYGAKVQAEGGAAVDRAALGRIVFHDAAERPSSN